MTVKQKLNELANRINLYFMLEGSFFIEVLIDGKYKTHTFNHFNWDVETTKSFVVTQEDFHFMKVRLLDVLCKNVIEYVYNLYNVSLPEHLYREDYQDYNEHLPKKSEFFKDENNALTYLIPEIEKLLKFKE